ncbi:MAG: hypothetical protein K9N06_08955 [Candidatus Cloacimonetes bacterium]|nr:hypothetical protein [Candidatus Cloacimonadota bacterium]
MKSEMIQESTALERNLKLTSKGSQELPENFKWLLLQSESKKGINERCQVLLDEYYHKYANQDVVVEHLVQVSLSDLWFYNQLEKREQAFHLLLSIFGDLLQQEMEVTTEDRLVQTLIRFTGNLAAEADFPEKIVLEALVLLSQIYKTQPFLLERNSNYLKNHFGSVLELDCCREKGFSLSRRVLDGVYNRWETLPRIETWYEEKKKLFKDNYKEAIKNIGIEYIAKQREALNKAETWSDFQELQYYGEIAQLYRSQINIFGLSREKIYFILYLFNLEDMYNMRKSLLLDLNRVLRRVKDEISVSEMKQFVIEMFVLFHDLSDNYRETVLDSQLSLGKQVLEMKSPELTELFVKHLIKSGFVSPRSIAIDNEWQVIVDRNHIKNIRTWLQLIELSPVDMKKLLSALIVNLRIGGIFVSDTDLFQKDISRFLQSPIKPVFKQVKQLSRLFPIYFNQIGAEGELRELTTAMDEIERRSDRLIHFFRKQVHTESNNLNVNLTLQILEFWKTGDKSLLKGHVPAEVINSIDLEGRHFVYVHELMRRICEEDKTGQQKLSGINLKEFEKEVNQQKDIEEVYRKKLIYLVRVYNMLLEKYSLGITDLRKTLTDCGFIRKEEVEELLLLLQNKKDIEALTHLLKIMTKLTGLIFSDEAMEAVEDIYYKRHVAAGIPSMYGQYHEKRFDALGLIFRLEQVVQRLFENIESSIKLKYITRKTLKRIYELLKLYETGLALDGIRNQGFESNLEMFRYSLESSFSMDQFVNIFQFLAENTKEILQEFFYRIYEQPLKVIILQNPLLQNREDRKQEIVKRSESFYRDVLTSAFIVNRLDHFIVTILKSIRDIVQLYEKPLLTMLMSFEPDQIVSPLYDKTPEIDNPVFLGSKAFFLKILYEKEFPIPPGFVLSTELFRHRPVVKREGILRADVLKMIKTQMKKLEKLSGREYGNPAKPLLLSVRSGTAISMPGAMNTFLNVGMNDDITEKMSLLPDMGWTAWDSYRRFLQSWGMALGITRDAFDDVISSYKDKFKVEKKLQFSKSQMREVALAYKAELYSRGGSFESDPFQQLIQAISFVLDSWDSNRAHAYREQMQIANEWGTAVIIQQMVLGNMSENSGSGVLFTRDPASKRAGISLYGEYTVCSQGEDIVAGLVNVLPLSKLQAKKGGIDVKLSLEYRLPQIFKRLYELSAQMLYKHGFSHQEIEFTFESELAEDLYILQTRNQDMQTIKEYKVFSSKREKMEFAGSGIGIGGGALNGILAFDEEDLLKYRQAYPEKALILVRPDTVPDDIGMIFKCDGLITGRGGATSHAAVTAVRLGKVCIVNCQQLIVDEDNKKCQINLKQMASGDEVAIDGNFGNIYIGNYPVHIEQVDYHG